MLVGLVVGSVWLGRRERRLNLWPRIFVSATSVTLVLFGLVAAATTTSGVRSAAILPDRLPGPYVNIQDVYVYDSQGRLVEGARIFDQNGQPIRLAARTTAIRTRTSRSRCGTSTRSAPTSPRSASHPGAPAEAEPTAEPTAHRARLSPRRRPRAQPRPDRDAHTRRLPELTRRLARANNCLHLLGGAWRHRA